MTKHVIYALIEPDTKEIRYIGFSSRMAIRYRHHLTPCFLKPKTHKNDWIKSLMKRGLVPELIILCDYETAEELPMAEKMWINNYMILGCDLVNGAEGGKGGGSHKGKKHSIEAKKKMSLAKMGKRKGWRWKIIDGKRVWYK